MVAIGLTLLALSVAGVLAWWHGSLFHARWLLWLFVPSVLGPQAATGMCTAGRSV